MARLSTKSFLNRTKNSTGENYSLFNPSIADYILNEYSKNRRKLTDIFKALYSLKSLKTLFSLKKGKLISSNILEKILDELFTYAFNKDKSFDYLIYISNIYIDDVNKKDKIISLLTKIINSPSPIDEFTKFLKLLSKYGQRLNIENYDFLFDIIQNRYLGYYEIKELTDFLDVNHIESSLLFDELKEQIETYMSDILLEIINELDISDYIDSYSELDFVVDEDSIKEELTERLVSAIDGFNSNQIEKLNFDYSDIVSQTDIDELVSHYLESSQAELLDNSSFIVSSVGNYENDIDDLFERS